LALLLSGACDADESGGPSPPNGGTDQEVAIPVQSEWADQGVAIARGASGAWDWRLSGATSPSAMIKKNGTYFLYFISARGNRNEDGGPAYRTLGVATSTDGITFTKYAGNPILTHRIGVGDQEEAGIFSATAFVDDDGTVVLYYGGMEETSPGSVDGDAVLATSTDGYTFTDHGDVWTWQQAGITTGNELFPMAAIHDDGVYHMWFMQGSDWDLFRVNGSARDAYTTDRKVLTTPSIYNASGPIRLSDTKLLLQMTNRGNNQIEMRTVSLSAIDNISAPEQTYFWSNYNEGIVYLDRDTMTWFLYQVSDNLNEIRVRTAPARLK
jgi:hypothetical protein